MFTKGLYLTDETVISNTIINAALIKKPKTRYAVGYMAKPVLFYVGLLVTVFLIKLLNQELKTNGVFVNTEKSK